MSDTASDIKSYLNDQKQFLDGRNYNRDGDNDTNYDKGGNENDVVADCFLKDDINDDELEDGIIFMDAEGNYYYQPLKSKRPVKASMEPLALDMERKHTLSPNQTELKENLSSLPTKSTTTPNKSPHEPAQACSTKQDTNTETTSKSEIKLSNIECEKCPTAVITSCIKMEPTVITSFNKDPPSPTQPKPKENLNISSTTSSSTPSKSRHKSATTCGAKLPGKNKTISSKSEMILSSDIELKKSPSAEISSSIKIEETEKICFIKAEPNEITSSFKLNTVTKIEKSVITSTTAGDETITSDSNNDEEIYESDETERSADNQDDPDYQNETDDNNDSDYVPETVAKLKLMSPPSPKPCAPGRYQCMKCEYNTDRRSQLSRHLTTHSEERPYKCTVCETGFKTKMSLTYHINAHLGKKPHQCVDCDKSFRTPGQLTFHRKCRHSGKKTYKCTECDYSCVELSTLQSHICSHTRKRRYQCPHCPYTTSDRSSLKRHIRVHTGEKPYGCEICHSRFTEAYSLKKHRWVVHFDNDKPVFKCNLCPATYSVKSDLRVHIQKQHDTDNPVSCKICDKVLPDRYSHRMHVKIHKGEEYRCKLCPYSTTFKYALDRHITVHSDVMPFNCELCGKFFRQKEYLNRHIKIHHSEKSEASAHKINGRRYPYIEEHKNNTQYDSEVLVGEEDGLTPSSPSRTKPKENRNSLSSKSTSTRSQSPHEPGKACSTKVVVINTADTSKSEINLSSDNELKKSPSTGTCSSIKTEQSEITSSIKFNIVTKIEKSNATSTTVRDETITSEINNDDEIYELEETERNVNDPKTSDNNHSDYLPDTKSKRKLMSPPKPDASARYQCMKCAYNTDNKYLLSRHLKNHSKERVYKCTVCERGFKTNIALVNHINAHLGKKAHQCSDCDKSYTTSGQLNRHRKYRHSGIKPYKCTECDKCYVELSMLRLHMCSHTGERAYQCPNCSYASSDSRRLKLHMKTHTGEKPYECDICHSRFTQSYTLKKHRLIHSNVKPVKTVLHCNLCPVTCAHKTALRVHLQKQHNTDNPVSCKFCDKVLPDRYSYKMHVKTHEKEKCYCCKLCPFAAKFKYKLDKHMAIHSNAKPFNCELCGKNFQREEYLKRHIKVHHLENYDESAHRKKGRRYPHSEVNEPSTDDKTDILLKEENILTPCTMNSTARNKTVSVEKINVETEFMDVQVDDDHGNMMIEVVPAKEEEEQETFVEEECRMPLDTKI